MEEADCTMNGQNKEGCGGFPENCIVLAGVILGLILGLADRSFAGGTPAPSNNKPPGVGLNFGESWTGDFDGMLKRRQLRAPGGLLQD